MYKCFMDKHVVPRGLDHLETIWRLVQKTREQWDQVQVGEKVTDVCRRRGVSEQTFYRWKRQCGGLGLSEAPRTASLRHENSTLKQVVTDLTHILQEIVRNKL